MNFSELTLCFCYQVLHFYSTMNRQQILNCIDLYLNMNTVPFRTVAHVCEQILRKSVSLYVCYAVQVSAELQQEVLMSLIQTDPDIIDYLLRRKLR